MSDVLGMRNPTRLTKDPNAPIAPNLPQISGEFVNSLDDEKLKSPVPIPITSPIYSPDKHINFVPSNEPIFTKIANRLLQFSPQIRIGEHIVTDPERLKELNAHRYLPVIVHRNTLDGIDFVAEDRNKLVCAIRNARSGIDKVFVEGNKANTNNHWPLAISFAATDGIGFREIFRPRINDRPLDEMSRLPFDNRLGADLKIDVSSLHIAIANVPKHGGLRSNIHIDNLTVTLSGLTDVVGISPTAISHIVNELIFKTKLQGKLPNAVIDNFDINLMNPYNGFLNAGVALNIINKPNFKWTISYSVGLNNNQNVEWSGGFKFEHSGGMSISVVF